MNDDLLSLKMLIISEAAPERELIRQAAGQGAVPIELVEVARANDPAAASQALEQAAFDAVFMDSRMPKAGRQAVLNAARAAKGRPLVILIGPAEMKTRVVLTDGVDVDGVLAKPIDVAEARNVIDGCVRSRLTTKVLIVDDSSTVRAVIRKVLQASRYRLEPEEVADGETAIVRAQTRQYSIIFVDCHMPGLDGFDTLTKIKDAHPEAKVVMITGRRDARIEDRARATGAADFLYKPFFGEDIDAVLNRLFGLMRPRWG
jgi:CheY-like chemotaxis protein